MIAGAPRDDGRESRSGDDEGKSLSRRVILCALLAALLGLAAPAWGQVLQAPWNLALVVDNGAAMAQPWLGTTRAAVAESALQLELRTLPLRVRAGVWLAGEGRGMEFIAPAPALEVKQVQVILPRPQGRGGLKEALALARDWVLSQGPGVVVLLAGPGADLEGTDWPEQGGEVFCHTVGLAPEGGEQTLVELARQGGGAFFPVARPGELGQTLHAAVLGGLSPARLLVLGHDERNQPRGVVFTMDRHDQPGVARQGRTGRPAQVMPGVHHLAWPAESGLGPAPLPKTVSVAGAGETRLWVGGLGRLGVEARDGQGKSLPWLMSVANLETGKLEVRERRAPFELELPAGFYQVKTVAPPQTWQVELGAGKRAELVAGPRGKLTLKLMGPLGPARVPFQVEDLQGRRPVGTGFTNSPMQLIPSTYRLTVQVAPPLVREATLAPAQELTLELPPVGAVQVGRDRAGRSQPYQALDPAGRPLLGGVADRPLFAQPGRFILRFNPPLGQIEAEVRAGELTSLDPPPPPPPAH